MSLPLAHTVIDTLLAPVTRLFFSTGIGRDAVNHDEFESASNWSASDDDDGGDYDNDNSGDDDDDDNSQFEDTGPVAPGDQAIGAAVAHSKFTPANLGVAELMLLAALDRAVFAKHEWSRAVANSQNTAAALLGRGPQSSEKASASEPDLHEVVLEVDGRPVEYATGVYVRPDVFVAVREAEKQADIAVAVWERIAEHYGVLHELELMTGTAIALDPLPWRKVSLTALRSAMIELFASRSARMPLISVPLAETEARARERTRSVGVGLVGCTLPMPAHSSLTAHSASSPLKKRSLVNYNNTVSARDKFVSPPTSAHSSSLLPTATATPASVASSAAATTVTANATGATASRQDRPRPRPLRIPAAGAAGLSAAEPSPLVFDKNRYLRAVAGGAANYSESPLVTPVASPIHTVFGSNGLASSSAQPPAVFIVQPDPLTEATPRANNEREQQRGAMGA